jgi:hypothetical protein
VRILGKCCKCEDEKHEEKEKTFHDEGYARTGADRKYIPGTEEQMIG